VQGRALAHEVVAVDGINPLFEAVKSAVPAPRDLPIVLICRDRDHAADAFCITSIIDSPQENEHVNKSATLLYASPSPHSDSAKTSWAHLIEASCAQAAKNDVDYLIAEAAEGSIEQAILLEAGFQNTYHQDIFKLTQPSNAIQNSNPVREQNEKDSSLIAMLKMRIVPKLVQRAYTASTASRQFSNTNNRVLYDGQELVGFIGVRSGRRGAGINPLFRHEGANEQIIADAIRTTLAHIARSHYPVYCTVPSFQSWLIPMLDQMGFVHVVSNVLMQRNITARVMQPTWETKTATNGKVINAKFIRSKIKKLGDQLKYARNKSHRRS